MSNFTRFNHKSLINPAYQDSEQYVPLKDIPFKKASDLFAINPEMTYSIRAMYNSTTTLRAEVTLRKQSHTLMVV